MKGVTRSLLTTVVLMSLTLTGCGESLPPGAANAAPGDGEPSTPSQPSTVVPPTGQSDVRCHLDQSVAPLTHATLLAPGPHLVASERISFVDRSRPTPRNGRYGGSDRRRLETMLFYPRQPKPLWKPRAELARQGAPFPLLIYSHGFASSNREATELARHLASHGFIVAAPTFPLSNLLAPGGPTIRDVANQPGDVAYIIDQMLAKSAASSDRFAGAIDAQRIAVAGLSLGGLTTSLAAFHRRLGDTRIKAALTLAGPSSIFAREYYQGRAVPLLMMHGEIDAFVDYHSNARASLHRAQPNVTLVSLRAGSHAGFTAIEPQVLVDALGKVVAPQGSNPQNPDALGCGLVAQRLGAQASALDATFIESIGGAADGIIVPGPGDKAQLPCANDNINKPALAADKQLSITKRAALAFLQAHFARDATRRARSCHYLRVVLDSDPDARVE